jgi:arylsulfatase A-like enzyme
VTRPASINHQQIISTDYFATIASITNIPAPAHDGIDLTPLLRDNTPLPKRPLFWHYPHYGNQGSTPGSAIRLGDWKLIQFFEDNRLELYNLETDLEENHNLAQDFPEIRNNLLHELVQWRKEVGARYPTQRAPAAP